MTTPVAGAGMLRRDGRGVGWTTRTRGRLKAASVLAGVAIALLSAACEDGPTSPPLRPPLEELPEDLAALEFTASGRPTHPYVMLELLAGDDGGFNGYVLVDARGRPVWFFRTSPGVAGGFARRANGNLVLSDPERGLLEVTTEGRVVRGLANEPEGGRRFHHDLLATPWNTVLAIADEWGVWRDTTINGAAVWEWEPETGRVERRWSAFEHLDPGRDRGPRYFPHDWIHPNSLALGRRGNVLLSLHFLDQVLSIAPDWRSLEWRLGGTRATIPVADPFSGQHTARETGPGRLLLFDNGFERPDGGAYSRAVEYELAPGGARKVWEWRPEVDNWARIVSSALRLANGHTFIAFGTRDVPAGSTGPIEAYEVAPDGAVRWHLLVEGPVRFLYRATPVEEF